MRSGGATAIGPTTSSADTVVDTVVDSVVDSVVDTVVDTTPATTEAPTTTEPLECLDASNLPELVRAETSGYDGVQSQEGLGADDKRSLVLFTSGGAVATQRGTGTSRSIEYRIGPAGGGGPKGSISKAVLFDLVPTSQGPAILYGAISAETGRTSTIVLLDIGSDTRTTIADVATDSFSAFRGAAANGLVITAARIEGGQSIATWAIDGSGSIDRFSPTAGAGTGASFTGPAVLSPDGKKLAWIEGPDPSKRGSNRKGDWTLVIGDADDGSESLRLKFAPPSDAFAWFDWDGSWAIISRGYGKPAEVIHTTESDATPQRLCNADRTDYLTGVISIVRRNTISTASG